MFKIIGADQREYGPVTADQVREWIAQGRANGATRVQSEGSSEWVPLSSLAEFAPALAAKAPASPGPPPVANYREATMLELPQRRYDVDIGACVSRSWRLLTENLGLLVGATIILIVLVVAFSQALGLITRPAMQSIAHGNLAPGPILLLVVANIPEMAFSSVLMGGYYLLLIKLARAQPAGLGDLFAGFRRTFLDLALAGIVVQALTMLGVLACIVPGIYLSVAWILTVPLIVDRRLGFWEAMELSRKVVTQRWWLMFCLLAVMALISLAGLLACCVGILPAVPLGLGALVFAYDDIFQRPTTAVP